MRISALTETSGGRSVLCSSSRTTTTNFYRGKSFWADRYPVSLKYVGKPYLQSDSASPVSRSAARTKRHRHHRLPRRGVAAQLAMREKTMMTLYVLIWPLMSTVVQDHSLSATTGHTSPHYGGGSTGLCARRCLVSGISGGPAVRSPVQSCRRLVALPRKCSRRGARWCSPASG